MRLGLRKTTDLLYADGCAAVPIPKRHSIRCRRAFLQDDAVLPPRQQVGVTARSTLLGLHHTGGNQIIDSHQVRSGLHPTID